MARVRQTLVVSAADGLVEVVLAGWHTDVAGQWRDNLDDTELWPIVAALLPVGPLHLATPHLRTRWLFQERWHYDIGPMDAGRWYLADNPWESQIVLVGGTAIDALLTATTLRDAGALGRFGAPAWAAALAHHTAVAYTSGHEARVVLRATAWPAARERLRPRWPVDGYCVSAAP